MTDSNLVANSVVASSSSQYISIVPENGEQFNPTQKIIYNIEPEIGYIKKDSYLIMDIQNTSADHSRYTLNKNLGAHALIDRVDIFSKETGILLESNTHYREWCNIDHQYLHDTHNNMSNTEGVGHPVQSWTHNVAADNSVVSKRSVPSSMEIVNNQISPVAADGTNGGAPLYGVRRFCIPLKVGLFGAYQAEEKAIPIMNFGGLRIEITLAKAKDALQRLGLTMKDTAHQSEKKDLVVDMVEVGQTAGVDVAAVRTGFTTQEIILDRANEATQGYKGSLQDTGLVVGNRVHFSGKDNSNNADFSYHATIQTIATETARDLIINGKTHANFQKLKITVGGITNRTATGGGHNNGVAGYKAASVLKVINSAPNYKLMNTEFRLKQIVAPPQQMDAGMSGINYEFTGYEVFFDNIPTATLRHQIPINSVASKSLAIFSQLYFSSNMDGDTASSQDKLNGVLPKDSLVNEVVFFINNRLYPLRSYNPQKTADRVLCVNELVKAFRAIGKQPMSLGSVDFGDMEDYTNTPLIARELARNGMVFDLRNAEPELRLNFSAGRTDILRVNTFVFSKKIIQTTANGLQVIH